MDGRYQLGSSMSYCTLVHILNSSCSFVACSHFHYVCYISGASTFLASFRKRNKSSNEHFRILRKTTKSQADPDQEDVTRSAFGIHAARILGHCALI